MRDLPRDITYCNNNSCTKKCERNLIYHDFRGCGMYSLSNFETVETYSEDYCPYFMELRKEKIDEE